MSTMGKVVRRVLRGGPPWPLRDHFKVTLVISFSVLVNWFALMSGGW